MNLDADPQNREQPYEAPSRGTPTIISGSSLRRLVFSDALEVLPRLVSLSYIPHVVFDLHEGGSVSGELARLADFYSTLQVKQDINEDRQDILKSRLRHLDRLKDLVTAGKIGIVGGAVSSALDDPAELEDLATWGDLGLEYASATQPVSSTGSSIVRIAVGLAETQTGAGIWNETHPEGPGEAVPLAMAIYRGWEVVTDSHTAHEAAQQINTASSRSYGRQDLRFRRTQELLADGVLSGLYSREHFRSLIENIEETEKVTHKLAQEPGAPG